MLIFRMSRVSSWKDDTALEKVNDIIFVNTPLLTEVV